MDDMTPEQQAALAEFVEAVCAPVPLKPIVIHLSGRPDGSRLAQAVWDGHPYSAASSPTQGALTAMARHLVAVGAPDMPWIAEMDGGVLNRGSSLHHLAGMTPSALKDRR